MSRTSRIAGVALVVAALTGGLAACGGESLEGDGGGSASEGGEKGSLVIGSAGFTESKVLAELYAQALKDAGYGTSIKTVETRELYEPSLGRGR